MAQLDKNAQIPSPLSIDIMRRINEGHREMRALPKWHPDRLRSAGIMRMLRSGRKIIPKQEFAIDSNLLIEINCPYRIQDITSLPILKDKETWPNWTLSKVMDGMSKYPKDSKEWWLMRAFEALLGKMEQARSENMKEKE